MHFRGGRLEVLSGGSSGYAPTIYTFGHRRWSCVAEIALDVAKAATVVDGVEQAMTGSRNDVSADQPPSAHKFIASAMSVGHE